LHLFLRKSYNIHTFTHTHTHTQLPPPSLPLSFSLGLTHSLTHMLSRARMLVFAADRLLFQARRRDRARISSNLSKSGQRHTLASQRARALLPATARARMSVGLGRRSADDVLLKRNAEDVCLRRRRERQEWRGSRSAPIDMRIQSCVNMHALFACFVKICLCIPTFTCMCLCVFVCVCLFVWRCQHPHAYVNECVRVRECACVHVSAHVHVCDCVRTITSE